MIPDRSELHGGDEEIVNRAFARAKGAWSASLREDDRLHRDASEKRLVASWPRPRVLPVRSFALGAAAAACVGHADWALARTLAYAQERQAFGRPIGRHQVLAHRDILDHGGGLLEREPDRQAGNSRPHRTGPVKEMSFSDSRLTPRRWGPGSRPPHPAPPQGRDDRGPRRHRSA